MAKLLVYYAHPGHQYSHANKAMVKQANKLSDITFVDLYAEYPRFNIDIDKEQQRLEEHDIIVFQFPMFWYSTPSLIKEWQDLVLEQGFAYGAGGEHLKGKFMMVAVSAAGPKEAFRPEGYQNFHIRTFLTPLQQTANLCQMNFLPPYVLYGALREGKEHVIELHAEGYKRLLSALRDENYDVTAAQDKDVVTFRDIPFKGDE